MKIKIVKCSNPNWWYNDLVGEELEVEKEGYSGDYKVKDTEKYCKNKNGFIYPGDAKIIENKK